MRIHTAECEQELSFKDSSSKRPSRIITASHDDEQCTAKEIAATNNTIHSKCSHVPVSPSTNNTTAPAYSITGRISHIHERYQINPQVIGSGRYGVVQECINRSTGMRYAVKSIHKNNPNLSQSDLARLPHEIMMLHGVKHRNIVQLVDVFEDSEHLYLVTNMCSGGELFHKIVEKSSISSGCFSEDEAARIMYQLLTAVSYMHKNDFVHRDIKPENIMFESTEEDSPIKLIDFGLARRHCSKRDPPITTLLGTQYYIAPEVLRKCYDKSCDLFSVGVVAYIMMCGYPPFNGDSTEEVHLAILIGKYSFYKDHWKGISRECRHFIYRLLQSDPRKRMTADQALRHPWLLKNLS